MGRCMNCGKEVHFNKDDNLICSCGEYPYFCWNCKEKLIENLHECSICGFFTCPKCGNCGKECSKEQYVEILKQKFNFLNLHTDNKLKEVIEFLWRIKQGNERFECERGVSVSYAKGKNQLLYYKLEGFDCKNKEDIQKFNERIDIIGKFPIGKQWTITQLREVGYKGSEWREASNIAICSGFVKKINIKDEKNKEYSLFERIEGVRCNHFKPNLTLKYQCPRCGKCAEKPGICVCTYVKGDNKGNHPSLKKIKTKYEICQLNRINFQRR